MIIRITLTEALRKCNDWSKFCNEFGWSIFVVNEGGGELIQELTESQAIKHGIIREGKD